RALEEPVDAVLQVAAELHLDHLRLDVDLHRHHVELLDHVGDRLPGARAGTHQQGIGLLHGRHADLVAIDFEVHAGIAVLGRAQRHLAAAAATAAATARAAFSTDADRTVAVTAGLDLDRIQPRHQRRCAGVVAIPAAG